MTMWTVRICVQPVTTVIIGSIARSPSLPVFKFTQRPISRFFSPQGRHVAPMGVTFGTEEETEANNKKVRMVCEESVLRLVHVEFIVQYKPSSSVGLQLQRTLYPMSSEGFEISS